MTTSTMPAKPVFASVRSSAPPRSLTTVAFGCAAMLVSYLPFSAANGALGAIGAATGASTGDLQWVTDAFAMALAGVILSAGVLADLYGRKRIALVGLGLTVLGTITGLLAGGLSGTSAVYGVCAGQALCGLGAGLVMSSTLALIVATAAPAQRSRAIAAWAACNVVGLGGGPFLSATLIQHVGFRWLFPPITLLALGAAVFGAARANETAAPHGRQLDWPGQVTSALGILGLIYGVIHGGSAGYTSPAAVGALAIGGLSLAAFVQLERRAISPLLRPTLFTSGGFSAAALGAMAVLFTVVGVVFVLSLFFAHQHVSALGIAVRLGCLFAGNALASLTAARLQTILTPGVVLLGGLLVAAAGLASLLTLTDSTSLTGLAWRLAVVGGGSGVVMATSTVVAVQSVSAELASMAGAANNAVRQLGAALGAAVLGVVFGARLQAGADYLSAVHLCMLTVLGLLVCSAAVAAPRLIRPLRMS